MDKLYIPLRVFYKEKPDTFPKNRKVAKRGGGVAGKAQKEAERELGRSVVSKRNYLSIKRNLEELK